MKTLKRNTLNAALCLLAVGHAHAAENLNPASIAYVNQRIAAAIFQTVYTAGTAITISSDNVISGNYQAGSGITISGNVISAPGSTPYTGTGAINVNASTNVISSNFEGEQGIVVRNDDGADGGQIQGYTAGNTTLTFTNSTTYGTPSTIVGNYQFSEGVALTNVNEVRGTYLGGTGITLDTTTPTPPTFNLTNRYRVGDFCANGVAAGTPNCQNEGGVVVYVEDPDSNGYGTRGLVIAALNASYPDATPSPSTMKFGSSGQYAFSNGIGSGASNTPNIIARERAAGNNDEFAAAAAAFYVILGNTAGAGFSQGTCVPPAAGGTYNAPTTQICVGGWYLPSVNELQLIAANPVSTSTGLCTSPPCNNYTTIDNAITGLGGTGLSTLSSNNYWSSNSTVGTDTNAFYVTVNTGVATSLSETNNSTAAARAFRQFGY